MAALWCAGGLFGHDKPIDRIRAVLVLGVAIPGVLGFVHLLYPAALWAVALILAAMAVARKHYKVDTSDTVLFLTLAALFAVLWPPVSRPLLEGDSLGYHLPNAMLWLQRHSVWNSSAPGWSYPPASELFAAGLLGAAGRWSLPWAGAVPAFLLAGRIYLVARRANAPGYAAAAVALALVFTPLFAFEAGTLQNDLWLTAFFVEILAAANGSLAAIAVCALLKPFGFVEAAIASIAARKPLRIYLLGLLPLAIWFARDLILYSQGTLIPPASGEPYWPSTIAANLAVSVPELVRGFLSAGPQNFVWLAVLVIGLAPSATRRYAVAGIAAFILYLFLPFSFRSTTADYLLDGSSLRYALPAFGAAGLVAALWAAKFPKVVAIAALALALSGAIVVLSIFWNDAWTHRAILVAGGALLAALLLRVTRGLSAVAALLAIAIFGAGDAQVRALQFYNDWMRTPSGAPTAVFTWLDRNSSRSVVAQNVRAGAILMVSPASSTVELPWPDDGCALARRTRSLLFIGTNETRPPQVHAFMFAHARACGSVLYEDDAAIVVRPS